MYSRITRTAGPAECFSGRLDAVGGCRVQVGSWNSGGRCGSMSWAHWRTKRFWGYRDIYPHPPTRSHSPGAFCRPFRWAAFGCMAPCRRLTFNFWRVGASFLGINRILTHTPSIRTPFQKHPPPPPPPQYLKLSMLERAHYHFVAWLIIFLMWYDYNIIKCYVLY